MTNNFYHLFLNIYLQGIHGQMHQHCETFKVNHEFRLLTAVENLKEKSNQGEQKLKEKDLEITQLKASNTVLKQDCENLKTQLEIVREHLETKIERNCEKTNNRFKEINKKQSQQSQKSDKFKANIDNLQTYAQRSSKLHFTLSEKWLRSNRHYGFTLFQKNYDRQKNVIQWNEMIKAVNEDDSECNYLKTLKASINQYKQTIYSATYKKRFENFCYFSHEGVFYGVFGRFGCTLLTKSICFKMFGNYNDFAKEVEADDKRRMCKVQNNYNVCSYHVGDCLHVVVSYIIVDALKVYLLHNSTEEEKLH